jgi:V8-like Glu-specific endopeptidase
VKIALSLLALVTACTSDAIGTKSSPIRDGTRTTGDPAVVAIIARRARCAGEDPTLLCTGTLVAPKVVLTAAHCLDAFGEDGAYEVAFGASLAADGAKFVWVRRSKAHPGYVEDTHENDVALLELDEPAPTPPATTTVATLKVGARARIVGFGETRVDGEPPGIKRTGDTTIDSVSEKDFRASPLPSMSCAGDSGGPVFVTDDSGVETLAGITVRGDPACKSFAVNLRVDAYWPSFVQPFVDEVAASPEPAKSTVATDAICSKSCGASDVCPRQTTCLPDDDGSPRCTTPSLGVGAYDGACTTDDQCASGAVCAHVGPDACACFRPCNAFADPAAASPSPVVVHAVGGGCAVGRSSVNAFVGGLLFVCALVRRRRQARAVTTKALMRCSNVLPP